MSIKVLYNEIDQYCCAWLSNLMDAGHIRPGVILDKSIASLTQDDVRPYDLVHFFAGIAGWDHAITLAGWQFDGRVTWTGSCPCQPFSAAGAQRGSDDERHLWPAFFGLIRECRPATVFGEQVAGAGGLAWLDHVCADLEGAGYAAAAANLGAHSAGAPHMRQRLYWVAHAERGAAERRGYDVAGTPRRDEDQARQRERLRAQSRSGCDVGGMGHAESARSQGLRSERRAPHSGLDRRQLGLSGNAWADAEWLACTDGKARPTQRGIFPLAHGVPKSVVRSGDSGAPLDADATGEARVMRLRGYGNAIVPQVAAMFVRASMDASA